MLRDSAKAETDTPTQKNFLDGWNGIYELT